MTKDEALKLALEVLEEGVQGTRPLGVATLEAIATIKEALMSGTDGAQPEQEPVGYWMGEFNGGAARLYEVPQESMFGRTYRNIPLYTTPPQRPSRSDIKPLTDEETYKIQTSVGYSGGFSRFVGIVRAIEAAHGIKGEA